MLRVKSMLPAINNTSPNTNIATTNQIQSNNNSQITANITTSIPNAGIATRSISSDSAVTEYNPLEFIEKLTAGSLPNTPIKVMGDVLIENNDELTQLPENLIVEGTLTIETCSKLTEIAIGLKAQKLSINYCENLTNFAKNVTVDSLEINFCESFNEFNNILINKKIIICNCSYISNLPNFNEQLEVGIYLCDNITLPETLNNLEKLTLFKCGSITHVPENMNIRDNLSLDCLENLVKLPDNLKVAGNISICRCRNLRSLPSSWLANLPASLPVITEGEHTIKFEDTGVTLDEINRYNTSTPENVHFYIQENIRVVFKTENLNDLISFWKDISATEDSIEITDLTNEEIQDLHTFLQKLTKTASYININTRKHLANQVINVLKLIANNVEIKEQALAIIHNTISACADRISVGLADLDLLPLVFEAENQSQTDKSGTLLLQIAKNKLYINEIKLYAITQAAKIRAEEEEIEFILAYLIKLSDYFSLPITVKEMNHAGIPNINDDDVAIACEIINTKVTDEYFNNWLINWEPWQKHKRRWSLKAYADLTSKTINENNISIDERCIISMDKLEDITDPVYYNNQLYSYESLAKWFIEKGTNPLDATEVINIDNIYSYSSQIRTETS